MNKHTNATTLLEKYFDVAFAAPDGIKKLRELILSLAMQGKLVPQDPNDQPASKLLKEIEAEKKRLVKDGKIKQSKPLPEIKPDELPYDLPKSWEWVRIRNVCHDWGQKTPDKLFTYIDVGSIDNKRGVISDDVQLLESVDAPSRARKIVRKGTVIYSTVRPYLLNIAIVDKDFSHEPIASTAFAIIHSFCEISNRFIYYYLRSPVLISYVESTMKGVAYPAINDGDFFQCLFPLPPLAEQQRIVAKIDELMARCDELEKLRGDRDRKQITVHTAALNRLLMAKEQSDFNTAWQFITQHFGELYSVKENVSELRKAILQLAVMDKLVPQDPSDQPASELLKEIEEEKERLVKEGKIKKSKPLPESKPDEVPYDLPRSWEWVTLEQLVSKIGSGSTPRGGKDAYEIEGIPFLRSQNIWNNEIRLDDVAFISEETHRKMIATKVIYMDILLNITGASLGRCAIVPDDFEEANVSQHVTIIRCVNPEIRRFIHCLLLSPYGQSIIWSRQVGMSREGLSKKVLEQFQIPLPPLAAQHRIVAKIDQLMALCDNLEKQIDNANSKQTNLLNAVMTNIGS